MNYVAWDIEIAAIVPEGETDWKAHRPLGITCGAFAWMVDDAIHTETMCGIMEDGEPARCMEADECRQMVEKLRRFVEDGYTILTHNGLGFDFDILAEESGLHDECVDLTLNHHVDTMLHFLCLQGYPVGLDTAAKGMRVSGKTEGMDGAKAPVMWANGEYDAVLEYVEQDCITTLEMALAVEKHGYLQWTSKRGRLMRCPIRGGWLLACEALKLPEPNTSWMTGDRWTRDKIIAWTQQTPEPESEGELWK